MRSLRSTRAFNFFYLGNGVVEHVRGSEGCISIVVAVIVIKLGVCVCVFEHICLEHQIVE